MPSAINQKFIADKKLCYCFATSAISVTISGYKTNKFPISAFQLAFHLGLTIFRALEFGFQEEEERRLGADLERLIDLMTAEPGEYSLYKLPKNTIYETNVSLLNEIVVGSITK